MVLLILGVNIISFRSTITKRVSFDYIYINTVNSVAKFVHIERNNNVFVNESSVHLIIEQIQRLQY